MISVATAREKILEGLAPLPAEIASLDQALGRVLAERVEARVTQPPVDQSAMDGYALRADDLPAPGGVLTVIAESAAGDRAASDIGPGECVRIFTGGPVPPHADCVIIQEDASRDGNRVRFAVAGECRRHIRPAGQDFRAGATLLEPGLRLGARHLALAAAGNVPWLAVRRRPRVAVLATGDELVMPGEPVGPGKIVSSSSIMLPAMIREAGGEPVRLGIAADRRDRLEALVANGVDCDVLVTIGGASVGDHDLVKSAFEAAGGRLDFWRVALRPGMPLVSGRIGRTRFLGLPGNPVSSFMCAFLFLLPMLNRLQGLPAGEPAAIRVRTEEALAANGPRETYLRAVVCARPDDDLPVCRPVAGQDSALLAMLASADGLIRRLAEARPVEAGGVVTFIPFPMALPYHHDA